jgi:hypothetical protein
MLIFIDESGSFVIPPHGGISISCVGAVVVPEATANLLWSDLDRVRLKKGFPKGELKGSSLGETEVARIIDAAGRHGVRFFVTGTEMSQYLPDEILRHRDGQADRIVASLTPEHLPSLVRQMHELREKLRRMSPQLYVQFALLSELVSRILRTITVNFSIFRPRELGAFHWRLDGKDSTRTQYERLWELLGGFMIQSIFLREPFSALREGDYTDFDTEFLNTSQDWPEHLPLERPPDSARGRIIDLKKIMQGSMNFSDSRSSRGLQLADVLTNAYRRALMGRLQFEGWKDLPTLMLKGEHPAIGMLHMAADGKDRPASPELAQVLSFIESHAKFLLES